MTNTQKHSGIVKTALIAMFIAIMAVMNFTPIGYITIAGSFSITLMTIPVALGAVCTGISGGAILGFVFGLTSFLQAFGIGFMIDPTAAPLFSESPLGYTVTCFVPRILAGLAAGIIFSLFEKRDKVNTFAFIVSSSVVPILNTALFMSSYVLFYSNTSLGGAVMSVLMTILTLNFLLEFLVTALAGTEIGKVIYKQVQKLNK